MNSARWAERARVSDVIGRLIEFWGFKRNMGRVWAVLYLSPEPLSAEDLRHALTLSSGAVSMTLSEPSRWGRAQGLGPRRAQGLLRGRGESLAHDLASSTSAKAEIGAAIEALAEALRDLDRVDDTDPRVRARVALQRERIGNLLELAKLGQQLLEALLATAKLDAEPLVRFLLGKTS
ncbi:MAG: hypothetical protein U0235_24915 [Polyangiaceae bacterium]